MRLNIAMIKGQDWYTRLSPDKLTPKARKIYDLLSKEKYLEVSTAYFEPNQLFFHAIDPNGHKEWFYYHNPGDLWVGKDGRVILDLFMPSTLEEYPYLKNERYFKDEVKSNEELLSIIRACYSELSGEMNQDADGQGRLF